MRVVEATTGGIITMVVVLVIANRIDRGDPVLVGALAFLFAFLAVLLRPSRPYHVERRRR